MEDSDEVVGIIEIPEDTIPLWTFEVRAFIDSDGDPCFVWGMVGDTTITDLVGHLTTIQHEMLLQRSIERAQEDDD